MKQFFAKLTAALNLMIAQEAMFSFLLLKTKACFVGWSDLRVVWRASNIRL